LRKLRVRSRTDRLEKPGAGANEIQDEGTIADPSPHPSPGGEGVPAAACLLRTRRDSVRKKAPAVAGAGSFFRKTGLVSRPAASAAPSSTPDSRRACHSWG
jgi:hypothetical protein